MGTQIDVIEFVKRTYEVGYVCENCGHRWVRRQIYGIPAPDCVICPNCGCGSGHKALWGNGPAMVPDSR